MPYLMHAVRTFLQMMSYVDSGMRSVAARLLGTGNGSKALSFGGGNGASRAVAGSSRIGGGLCTSTVLGGSQGATNYDGKGTYIVFNAADTLFISDFNSQEKVFSHFTGCKLRTVFVVFFLIISLLDASYAQFLSRFSLPFGIIWV